MFNERENLRSVGVGKRTRETEERMAFSQSDVDNLQAAIADGRGARTITFSDQSVIFNSITDMLALLAVMRQEVNLAASTPRHYRLAATSKGV